MATVDNSGRTLSPEFLAVGHLSFDHTDRGIAPGGAVAYGALTAKAFGCRSAIVTSSADDYPVELLSGIPVTRVPSSETTAFRNRPSQAGRVQSLLARAGEISVDDVPARWRDAAGVLLCPLAREFDEHAISWFPNAVTGAILQGWLREWGPDRRITLRSRWVPSTARKLDFVVISSEELTLDQAVRWSSVADVVVVTTGADGVQMFVRGDWVHVSAPRVVEVDATGAGDVWAAAFLVQRLLNRDPLTAARIATCAASLSVTKPGLSGIPTEEAVAKLVQSQYSLA